MGWLKKSKNEEPNTAKVYSGSDLHNYAEYSVAQKAEGKNLRNRMLLILLYILAAIAFLAAVFAIGFVPIIATLPLLEWALVSRTWKYVQVEHEYSCLTGVLIFTEVYGNRKRKTALTVDCREMSRIAPLGAGYDGDLENVSVVYDFRGSRDSQDAYFATFNQDNKKAVVYFEATEKVVKLLKLYNPSATVVSKSLRF